MSDQVKFEVYKASRTSQDKYTYFQLTASGAAIALAINQTHESSIQWSQLPLAFAVIVWGLSFFFGCRQLTYVNAALNLNMELLNVQKGSHSVVGGHPERIQVASEAIKELIENDQLIMLDGNFAHLQLAPFFISYGTS
ncbi:MAG: hypothetical protein FJX42_01440 [Alphaproteobacteria bacterium]|nr:hypothetical protein [Alphaproteobacteria bacterium]